MAYIVVDDVTKMFGKETAVDHLSLSIEQGEIHGLIGRNGSGKTVLMKMICGFLQPTQGTVTVGEKQIGRECDFPPETGVIIEAPGFCTSMSGYENLKALAGIRGWVGRTEIRKVMRKVNLDPDSRKRVSGYSMGMRQRLGIAQAIMEEPKLLILDEPFNGLDRKGAAEIRDLLLELREQGTTIVVSSHYYEDIEYLCDAVTELDHGRIVKQSIYE